MIGTQTVVENASLFFRLCLTTRLAFGNSARSHAVQEQFDGSASPPLLKLRIGRDSVEVEAHGVPEQKIEEQLGREFGVVDPYFAASRKLPKQYCDAADPTHPTLLMGELCQFRKLNGLRRNHSP